MLTVHHRRERKTGPQIALTVLQCRTHRRAFTLYPLGHLPYGRLAIAPVGLDGELLRSTEEPEAGDKASTGLARHAVRVSKFAAVLEPAVKLTDSRWWATDEPEQLAHGATLLGVHPDLSAQEADAIAFRLEIPRLVLRQAADAYVRGRGRAARGRVLIGVLSQLGDTCLLDRLLAAGARAGCWGTVTRWDAAIGGARGQVFLVAAHPQGKRCRLGCDAEANSSIVRRRPRAAQ